VDRGHRAARENKAGSAIRGSPYVCWMNSVLLLASTQESSRPATRGADDGRRGSSWLDALHRPPVPVGRGSGAVRPSQVASQHPGMLLVGPGTFCGVGAAV